MQSAMELETLWFTSDTVFSSDNEALDQLAYNVFTSEAANVYKSPYEPGIVNMSCV